ncbi:MAG TPA: hypothetical protein VGM29_09095, partial [Polyangiaceae bacterium]
MSRRKRRASGPPARAAGSTKRGGRKRASSTPRVEPRAATRPARRSRALRLGIALAGVALAVYGPLLIWAHLPGPGPSTGLPGGAASSLGSPCTAEHVAEQLAERQLIRSPGLFRVYLTLVHPAFHCVEHDHPLTAELSPSELVNRIDGSPFRTSVRVPVPEGLNHMDLATRFEETRVSSSAEFLR